MQTLPNIQNQLSSNDLFDAFKLQLAKDFGQSNFPSDFVAALVPDYTTIRDQIAAELERNEKQTPSSLMHLLYRIDISEAQLKKHLHQHKNENRLDALAELIIKRVLQKVVIKQFYKNKT